MYSLRLRFLKFMRYFREKPLCTIRETLLRNSLTLALKLKERDNVLSQLELLRALITCESKFILIILDAFRYDVFKALYHKHFHGTLHKVRSPGSDTVEWLMKVFPYIKQVKDLYVFSANPIINRMGIEYRGFRATRYINKDQIVDVWDLGWDDEFCTVPPWKVNEIVKREGVRDKMIIWYLQPHFPWLNSKELFKELIGKTTKLHRKLGDLLIEYIKDGRLSRLEVWKSYIFNAIIVLREVSKLVKYIKELGFNKPIIITSDHGELLGEYGYYWHMPNNPFPELIHVPWLEVGTTCFIKRVQERN